VRTRTHTGSPSPTRQKSFFNTANANAAALSVSKSFNYNASFNGYSTRSSADFTNLFNNDSNTDQGDEDGTSSRFPEAQTTKVDPMSQKILLSFIDFLDFGAYCSTLLAQLMLFNW
jgi:hypothetical protein